MKREDIDYMLKWKPSLGRKQPPVTTRRAAVKKSVSPEDETAEGRAVRSRPRRPRRPSRYTRSISSDSDTGGSSGVSPFAELVGERNAVSVDGATYAKLALVGRGGSSKVFRVLSSDGSVLALKRIRLTRPGNRPLLRRLCERNHTIEEASRKTRNSKTLRGRRPAKYR